MQDKYAQALTALGGMAAVGGFIDLLLYRDRKRVEAFMIKWWVLFTDVKWSNFGRKEAGSALLLLDKYFGARLLSVRRWKAVGCISLGSLALGTVWALLLWYRHYDENYFYFSMHNLAIAITWAVASTMALAIAFSVMRTVTLVVSQCAPVGALGFLFFCGVLFIHVGLLLYWAAFSQLLIAACGVVVSGIYDAAFSGRHWTSISAWFVETMPDYARRMLMVSPVEAARRIMKGLYEPSMFVFSADIKSLHKTIMDLLSNGLRIWFAVFFLSSFLFGSFLQPTVSRIWEGVIEAKKLPFTSLFGGIGAIFAALKAVI